MKSNAFFNNKIVMALLSLVLAFGLWLYVITVVSPGSETTIYNIPVDLQGETMLAEKGLMLTSETDATVDLRLAGNRTDLNKLDKSNITVTVDLTKIYDPGTQDMTYSVSFPGDIPNNAVTVQSKDPYYIRLVVEEREEKEVPVNVVYVGTTPENFVKEKEEIDYTNITVVGPKSVVDTVTQAVVEIDLTDRTETIIETKAFTLCDEEGQPVVSDLLKTNDITEVTVTVPVVMIKEIPLKLNVVDGGGATEENSNIELSHTSISVSGPEAILSGLDELVLGTVNLGEIEKAETLEFEVKLPEGLTNETGVTKVTVDISFPNLQTKTFQVTNIQYINLPDGMSAVLKAEVVEVTVRGNRVLINQMTEADLIVMVDLTNAQIGTEKYDASIVVGELFSDVGAVGSYSVTATVSQED